MLVTFSTAGQSHFQPSSREVQVRKEEGTQQNKCEKEVEQEQNVLTAENQSAVSLKPHFLADIFLHGEVHFLTLLLLSHWPQCRFRDRSVPGSKPDSTEEPSSIGPIALEMKRRGPNALPLMWCGSLEREVGAQMSSSSSDLVSKFRGPYKKWPSCCFKMGS
ncbi:hypothetical protein AVEN_41715-1 [Araneus ventricosus]|uniref:Uncharacterized protein n=1 Tax=Araneus ventricosus TaxID=182803 RepID=A0A4Y2ACC1_ARAVE|nr:hypothetical protein AVEN_41715-1 [Araneus ventricosus]